MLLLCVVCREQGNSRNSPTVLSKESGSTCIRVRSYRLVGVESGVTDFQYVNTVLHDSPVAIATVSYALVS